MASWYTGERRDLAQGAALIDPAASIMVLSLCDPRNQALQQFDLLDSIAEAAPANLKCLIELESRAWREMLPKTSGLTAISADLAVDGLRAMTFVESSDASALLSIVGNLLSAPELAEIGVMVDALAAREVSGTSWTEYRVRFDVEKFVQCFDDEAVIPPEDRAKADLALATFLGADGLRVGLADRNGFLVARIGGDDAFATRTAARVGTRPTGLGTGIQNALANSRSVNAAWLAQLDIGRVLTQVSDLATRFGEPLDIPRELIGESFPITLHAVVDGLVWRGAIEVDAEDIARFVRALDEK